jgi:O-antigen/teichoic acid export membrane protein
MADALLAGLPRIARVAEEVRLRGVLAIAVAGAAAAWWTIQWLLDQEVEPGRTWALALLTAVLAAVSGLVNVPRRLREGLRDPRFPSARVVYETRADGRDRRVRLSGAVFLSTIVILMVDQVAGWGGVTAGVIVGAAVGLGVADLVEARRWARAERERDADLFVKLGPRALVAGYGRAEVYEVPAPPKEGNAWS